MRRLILSSAFLGLVAVASAQAQVTPGWSAFAGCWTPVAADGSRNIAANTPRVCVVPDANNGAELITIVSDSVTERTTIDASGQRREVSKQGCSGWESAEFSSDGRRLYMRGEQTCASGIKRMTSGIFAIATNGDWVSAVNAGADSSSSVRVSRYGTATLTAAIPANIRDALQARELSDRTGRSAAQREVSADAVIEASRFLSAPAIEAWLAELEQDFRLDERSLIRLADAGVEPSVIDMMVAVSNPNVFAVRSTGTGYETVESDSMRTRRGGDRYAPCFAPVIDPWAWYAYDPCDPYLRYGFYRSRYYRYGYGSRYDPYYGYGYYDGWYGRPATIIVVGSSNDQPRNRGRMTKDGYKPSTPSGSSGTTSRGTTSEGSGDSGRSSSGSGGRTATRKPPSGESSSASSSSVPKEASSSSGSSSSGSSSSSGRTATRKPPA